MKITKVDILQLDTAENKHWRPILCRIFTDEGVYGDGEAALAYATAAPAAFGMVKDFASLIIGLDPLEHEVIWDKLYKGTFWGQNGGPVVFAGISAIDIALWDIKGKAYGKPVYQLLGGKKREKLRTYASQLQFGWSETRGPLYRAEDYGLVAREVVAEGYNAVKVDFFTYDEKGARLTSEKQTRLLSSHYLNLVEERVAATREAVGPDVDIIVENHSNTDALSAIQIGRRIEKYNIFYYEEPTTPNPKTFAYISSKLDLPLASGERIYSRWQYAPYFENSSLQVIQPDLGNTGGITEGKKICDAAYVYDISVQLHVCGSPIAIAAALHLETVIPNFLIHEHHFPNGLNRKLCIHDYQPENSYLTVPELPGLGNEISRYVYANSIRVTVE